MNVVATCNITLSKKLEKICCDSPIFLSSISIDKNKSFAKLKFGVKSGVSLEDIKRIGETSIIVKISDVIEESQDVGDGIPVGNIYTSDVSAYSEDPPPMKSPKQKPKHTNVVNAIAITNPDKEMKKYINGDKYISTDLVSNYDELLKLLSSITNIDTPIPTVTKKGLKPTREEAIEYEKQLLSVPKLQKGVYISNETGGRLCIDDLDVVLVGNEIFDLSLKPAKLIMESKQLKCCCERGFVKFRSKGEYLNLVNNFNSEVQGRTTLQVFDKLDQAIDNFANNANDVKEEKSSKFIEEKGLLKKLPSNKKLLISQEEESEVINLETELPPIGDNEVAEDNWDGVSLEETLDRLSSREIPIDSELSKLSQDLPLEKDDSLAPISRKPLLSEEAEKSEKKTIRRI